MLSLIVVLILVVGVNTALWGTVGLGRVVAQAFRKRPRSARHRLAQTTAGRAGTAPAGRVTPNDVAVLIAAHNEELVIRNTIRSAARLVPVGNIFIASDASKDTTAAIAEESGANVVELLPNRGKAGALVAAITHFPACRTLRDRDASGCRHPARG
ncbi:glycosyltransferase [Cryobacterium breve]|uniref:glycosyltransferase n=1 Tax=Cryobacterium breve TaxID=1259258 RepID=UPI00248B17A2|nr:glycosyltransferase [Cryobacterium breve]